MKIMNAPDNTPQMLDDAEVQKVREIVEKATMAQKPSVPKTGIKRRMDAINMWIMSHGMLGFATTIGMALLAVYTKSRPLADATLVLGIIVQLFGLALLSVIILDGALFFWQVKKSPYESFFDLARSSAEMDISFVHRLAHCQKPAIQYVLTYYKYERNGFEKRGALLAGSVERIGLFPALAALVLLVSNLAKVSEVASWAVMFGPLILAFYMMNMAAFEMIQKMDRVICMLEFCVQSRK